MARRNKRESTMNLKTTFAAALTALTLVTLAAPGEAQARHRGWGIAAGIIGAGIVAGAIASAAAEPVYVVEPRRCRYFDKFDRWGNYLGTRKVCRY
jgi:hypothetical protein